jgi:hypothetical protein
MLLHAEPGRQRNNWELMAAAWTIPITSIVFAPTSHIQSIVDLPAGMTYRSIDPEKPDQLPKLPGIDYSEYRRAVGNPREGFPNQ